MFGASADNAIYILNCRGRVGLVIYIIQVLLIIFGYILIFWVNVIMIWNWKLERRTGIRSNGFHDRTRSIILILLIKDLHYQ